MEQPVTNPVNQPAAQPPRPSKAGRWLLTGGGLVVLVVIGVLTFMVASKEPAPKVQTNGSADSSETADNEPQNDAAAARSIAPCDLLDAQARSQFKLAAGEPEDSRMAKGCGWNVPLESPSDPNNLYVQVKVYPKSGLDTLPALDAQPQTLTIGSHSAQQLAAPENSALAGVCAVDIALSSANTAAIRVTANGSQAEPTDFAAKTVKYCTIARQIAEIIEPKLPHVR